MRTIEDLDKGTIRRIDWQELIPGTFLFRAFSEALSFGALVTGTLVILVQLALIGFPPPAVSDLPILFRSIVCPFTEGLNILAFISFIVILYIFFLFQIRRKGIRLATTERVSWGEALCFALKKFGVFGLALSIPLAGFLLILGTIRLLSKSTMLFNIASPLILFLSFLCVFIALATVIGMPMIAAAIAIDNCDGFDAFSRAFSYVYQRPFHTLFYIAVGGCFCAIGFFLLKFIISSVLIFTAFAANLDIEAAASNGIWPITWWTGAVLLPYGFIASYAAIGGAALYLILRKNVDGISFDQITLNKEIHKLHPILSGNQEKSEPVLHEKPEPSEPSAPQEEETTRE